MRSFATADAIRRIKLDGCVELSDEQLAELQTKLYMMVGDMLNAAEESDTKLILGGGSALGAFRHGGIIPWDDDVDLMIVRSEFDRFISTFERMYADKYWIHIPGKTPGYNLLFPQIRLKGTSVRSRDDASNDECGLAIDLFVIENTYDNAIRRNWHCFRSMFYGFAVSARKFYRDRKALKPFIKGSGSTKLRIMASIKTAFGFLISFKDIDWWVRRGDRCHAACRDDNSRFVTVPTGRKHFRGEMYKRNDYLPGKKISFGPYELSCPGDIKGYLGRLYGDYDRIPEEDEREHHIYMEPFHL